MGKQKASGTVLAYLSVAVNVGGTFLLTPFLTRSLGIEGFGVYQLALAYAGYLILLNFGIKAIATREVANARASGDWQELRHHLGMLNVGLALPIVLLLAGSAILAIVAVPLFSDSIPSDSYSDFVAVYWLTVATLAVNLFVDLRLGVVAGLERFNLLYGLILVRGLVRPLAIILVLKVGFGAPAVAAIDLLLSFLAFVFLWAALRGSKEVSFGIPRRWDGPFSRQTVGFGLALQIGAIATVITMSADKVILGILASASDVAIFAVAVTLFTALGTVTLTIGYIFAPDVMRRILEGVDRSTTTALIAWPGRIQFAMGGSIFGGFVVFGHQFLTSWVGADYTAAYWPAVILITPNLVLASESLTMAVLDARMKRVVRSTVALVTAIGNLGLTWFLVGRLGYIGAAIGTACAIIVGDLLIMNVYYHRYLDIDVLSMFRQIMRRILPILVAATAIFSWINAQIWPEGLHWLWLMIAYGLTVGVGLFKLGFSATERRRLVDGARNALQWTR